MAYIKVDHSKFESTASEVDKYVDFMKKTMRNIQEEVNMLTWKGADAEQFKSEFNKVNNEDSTHTQMVKALETYARYLRFVANKYKAAQANAVNRANGLPRW